MCTQDIEQHNVFLNIIRLDFSYFFYYLIRKLKSENRLRLLFAPLRAKEN